MYVLKISFFREIILIYNPVFDSFETIDKRMNRTELKDMAEISFNVLAKMRKGETVSLESLHKICKTLNCNIGDIMEFADDEADA